MAKKGRYKFNYQQRTADDVRARAEGGASDFDRIFINKVKVFKPKDGKNIIRILPPTWEHANHYGYDIYVVYGVGPDNQSYLSLSKMKGKPDPLNEAYREAQREGDDKAASQLAPRKRVAMWIIDRDNESEGPQLWPAPQTWDSNLAEIMSDEDNIEDDPLIEIDHPATGRDVRFYKQGKGLNTKYNPAKMRILAQSPLHEDEDQVEEWLRYIEKYPIPDCLNFYSYDHIQEVFNGGVKSKRRDDDDDNDNDDDDDAPKSKRRKMSRDDDDDDDDDDTTTKKAKARKTSEDDDDEVDDDDEPKAKTKAKRSSKDDDDDDDNDADNGDDDDDDDDEPKKKRGRPKGRKQDDDDDDDDDNDNSKDDDDDDGDDDDDKEDEPPRKRQSIRERLKAQRAKNRKD